MLYQLPDGRTIEMSIEDYLSFSDTELRQLIGNAHTGDEINNPYYGSIINKPGRVPKEHISEENLNDISNEHKRQDKDFQNGDN
jgi:hypothetical protein